ncbi:hypothetical protein H0B56_16365 [Haloechinothrix sp. YIM 98757]|uniref:Uncharacterized protein n=1 Tax=Haloechinothrix aidingensis TaxID=2752311 RepID=A0A838AD70_9PSEU|nr:hypothetical protein [Haloechinothrix aidingensis]MBA0127125.1 hypothetical protein [Haloechinothrix aidingensis]
MRMRYGRIGAAGAAAALAMGGVLLAAPAQAQDPEGVGVSFFGHFCGENDIGPEPSCTYTPLLDHSYSGAGPFTIEAVDALGETVFATECANGELCTDEGAGSIPAGSTVTIEVTGEPGSVGAGAFQ